MSYMKPWNYEHLLTEIQKQSKTFGFQTELSFYTVNQIKLQLPDCWSDSISLDFHFVLNTESYSQNVSLQYCQKHIANPFIFYVKLFFI
jgi:nitrate reductase beta subunit